MSEKLFSIFDCATHARVSDESYVTAKEANRDYYMNAGHTYIAAIAQASQAEQTGVEK